MKGILVIGAAFLLGALSYALVGNASADWLGGNGRFLSAIATSLPAFGLALYLDRRLAKAAEP